MPREPLSAASRPARLPLPEPNRACEVATGQQVPIRTPGQREARTGLWQLPEGDAALGVPEPDAGIKSRTGEQTAIRGKDQTVGALGKPTRPEQGTTFDVPQLDAAIIAP